MSDATQAELAAGPTEAAPTGPLHPVPSAGRERWRRWAPHLVPPLVYLAAAGYYFWDFLTDLGHQIPGGADGVIYGWFFQAVEQSLVHLHNPLFTDAMNAPDGVNVMWNTSLLAVAIVCTPVTALLGGANTVVLVMALAPVVSATSAYIALRRITGTTWPAALAAALYGFGPFFVGQNGHLHLTFAFLPPLLLLIGWEVLVVQNRTPLRSGLKLGVLVGVALLVSEEIVALTAIVTVVAVAALAVLWPTRVRGRLRYAATATGVGVAVTAVIAGYPVWFQFFGRQSLNRGPVSTQRLDLAGLVRPSVLQYYASPSDIAANAHYAAIKVENTGYLGWPLIVLLLALTGWLVVRGDRFGWWWLITACVAVVLSAGTPIMFDGSRLATGPWRLVDEVPLFETVVAVRFTLLTTLLVALLLAWALAHARGPGVRAVLGIVTVVALVPLRPAGRYDTDVLIDTPRFFTTSAVQVIAPGSTVLLLPRGQYPNDEATLMMWQLRAHNRFKIVGGYAVFSIDGQMSYIAPEPAFAQLLQDAGDTGIVPTDGEIAAMRASLDASGTRYVVLAAGQRNALAVQLTAEQLTGCTWRPAADVQLCEVRR